MRALLPLALLLSGCGATVPVAPQISTAPIGAHISAAQGSAGQAAQTSSAIRTRAGQVLTISQEIEQDAKDILSAP